MFDDLILFVQIVECGNFSKAANVLNMYQSKISRRMSSLEEMLGAQLFKKNVKEMELTEQGHVAYGIFRHKVHSLLNSVDDYNALSDKVTGRVDVVLPPLFAKRFINNKLELFMNKYPDLELNLSYLVLNTQELNSFHFDLAISRIPASKPSYQQSTIYTSKLILCASSNYIEKFGMPQSFKELNNHKLIMLESDDNRNSLTAFNESSDEKVNLEFNRYSVIHNSNLAAYDMVIANAGLTFLLDYGVEEDIEAKRLIRVFPEYHFGEIKFHLIQSNFEVNKKLALFKQFLLQCID
jgi:DNA-binding transcriptional LysR family regulator